MLLRTLAKDPTHAVLGMTLDNRIYTATISSGPHWIVAGTTGSGKSVAVNWMLVSMMAHASPKELKIIWVDPKFVEAAPYHGMPFCPVDPITNMDDAQAMVEYLCWMMDERYQRLAKQKVKNIGEYNQLMAKKYGEDRTMPYVVLVFDEYADMVQVKPEVEQYIQRIGQKARAAGIHLILATQRPSVTVISPLIKANVPGRIALKALDGTNSHIILDEYGAEGLNGKGDALIKEGAGNAGVTRIQFPYLDEGTMKTLFSQIRDRYPDRETIDYKSRLVKLGLYAWAEDYADSVPIVDRRLSKPRPARGRIGLR